MRGLAGCQCGAIALEFALASVPLMMLMFGFIATSAIFNTWSSMQANSQYAARMMSTGQAKNNANGAIYSTNASSSTTCSPSLTSAKVGYYACTGLPSWATYTVTTTEN